MEPDEEILVVPRARLLIDPVHGFSRHAAESYLACVRAHGVFRRRAEMEHDPSMKQIIPYLIVRHDGRLFLFQRSSAGGEARLRGLYSIGVGGHINREDVDGAVDSVAAGLRREIDEELVIGGPWNSRLVGVLNDDTNPVGQVHFGLVHLVDVATPDVSVREADRLSGRLAGMGELMTVRDQMETWSQLILDAVDPTEL